MSGEFSVFQFFSDETYEEVYRNIDAETSVLAAKRLTVSVGGRLGTTRRVIITDGGDSVCFEWKYGQGVTFPPTPGGAA